MSEPDRSAKLPSILQKLQVLDRTFSGKRQVGRYTDTARRLQRVKATANSSSVLRASVPLNSYEEGKMERWEGRADNIPLGETFGLPKRMIRDESAATGDKGGGWSASADWTAQQAAVTTMWSDELRVTGSDGDTIRWASA